MVAVRLNRGSVAPMIQGTTCDRPSLSKETYRRKSTESFTLGNSEITVVDGPALVVRIERDSRTEWGYVAPSTVEALEEVCR